MRVLVMLLTMMTLVLRVGDVGGADSAGGLHDH